jgi:hypothetical protein
MNGSVTNKFLAKSYPYLKKYPQQKLEVFSCAPERDSSRTSEYKNDEITLLHKLMEMYERLITLNAFKTNRKSKH